MRIKIIPGFILILSISYQSAVGQKAMAYNLADMLQKNQIITTPSTETKLLTGSKPGAISSVRPVLFKDISFTEGIIDIDLRGRNKFLQSFLGILFHAEDTLHSDMVFFRPFNFKHEDTNRHYWSVTYLSMPEYPWTRLRKEYPHVYENKIEPAPDPDDWFHATIVLRGTDLKVYVNHAATPSLEVQLLNGKRTGKFGLFSDGLQSDFANLVITPLPDNQKTVYINAAKIKVQKMAIIPEVNFQYGVIEADLKGQDNFQKSFLGIAFHIKDTSSYEVAYFRPFNFNTTDSIRHHHAVQYMQLPNNRWDVLRKEKPEQYESNIIDPPKADAWFHMKLVVEGDWITVYVNHSCIPSLHVKSLWNNREGKIALWTDGVDDLFSDVYVTKRSY